MSDKGAVDKLKDKLYSRTPSPGVNAEQRTPLTNAPREHLGRSWDGIKKLGAEAAAPVVERMSRLPEGAMTEYSPKHRSWAARFLWGSVAFFAMALGASALTFFVGGNTVSPSRIGVEIVAPSLVDSGKETQLQFIVSNGNGTPLRNADLIIDYPEGTRSAKDLSRPLAHERQTIGEVAANGEVKRTSRAVFYGAEGTQQTLRATLEYQIPNSNSIFTREESVIVTVGSAPVSIEVSGPSEAIAGQLFGMDIILRSNASTEVADAALQIQAPFGFSLTSSNPAAVAGGTLVRLGSLKPGEVKTVRLTGTLDGQDGDARVFRFIVGALEHPTDTKVKVPLVNVPQTLTVKKPFVSATIALNGKTGTVPAPLGQTVQGVVSWTNNLRESVSNATFTLSLKGVALDPTSVRATSGFYHSANSTIVWNKDLDPGLALLGPGQTGELTFSFSTVSGTTVTNPDVTLNLTVKASRAGEGNVPEEVTSAASARVTLASSLALSATALHFSGPFSNGGPMPPKADQQTTYTVTWSVKNSSNSASNARVSAILPPNVEFIAAAGGAVSFDPGTRAVTWNIGELLPGEGFSSAPRQTSFQVALTPSVSQVGAAAPLTGGAQLIALDRFAGASIQANASALTTRLTGAPGFTSGMELVQSP